MENYFETLNKEIKQYLKILSPEFPKWLLEYINTPEMIKLNGIGMSCGTLYTKVYNDKYYYSSLTHSIAVALIIWNFTHDKKQTIAGLFHDIATPTFKHCIDFMNGDSEHQESTEERTEQIIKNSKEIMQLLNRDNIKLEEVSDYHIYPIADNDTPRLSSDRLEYTLSGGLYQVRIFELSDIERYYNNITILENEEGIPELAFKDLKVCEEFIHDISKLWPRWIEDEDRLCMQFIADIIKSMNNKGYITIDDLYSLTEKEIIQLIENCKDSYIKTAFKNFQTATRKSVYKSEAPKDGIYCTSVKGKKRYINPLVKSENKVCRIKDVSLIANNDINEFLNIKLHNYIGFDFEFKPYNSKEIVFVTHNKGKAKSAEKYFKNLKISTYDFELEEPRSDDLKEIATAKVKQAYKVVGKPCIALDTGFFIEELNGFPRAFVNFALDTIGIEGILKLMEHKENRKCKFDECLAYFDGKDIHYFYGNHPGSLAYEKQGIDRKEKWSDLWYVFKPKGFEKTLAEMNEKEREDRRQIDGSYSAMEEFAKWYQNGET